MNSNRTSIQGGTSGNYVDRSEGETGQDSDILFCFLLRDLGWMRRQMEEVQLHFLMVAISN